MAQAQNVLITEERIIEDGIEYTIETTFGVKLYHTNGKVHRLLGPAVIVPHMGVNTFNGVFTKLGSIIKYEQGNQYWYYLGQRIKVKSQEEYEQYLILKAFI